jgi:hypothetical protein
MKIKKKVILAENKILKFNQKHKPLQRMLFFFSKHTTTSIAHIKGRKSYENTFFEFD